MPEIKHLHGDETKRAQVATEVLDWAFSKVPYFKKHSGVYATKTDATPKFRIFAIDKDHDDVKTGFFSNNAGYINTDATANGCPVVLVVRTATNANATPTVHLPQAEPQHDYYIYLLNKSSAAAGSVQCANGRPNISSLKLADKHLRPATQAQQTLLALL